MSTQTEDAINRLKYSPLNVFTGEIFIDCECGMAYTVPEKTISFKCSNVECGKEIRV